MDDARHAHPGARLRDVVLPALGLTHADAAIKLNLSIGALDALLSGQTNVGVELAIKLKNVTGYGVDFWLGMQAAYDLKDAEPFAPASNPFSKWLRPRREVACATLGNCYPPESSCRCNTLDAETCSTRRTV